MRGIVRDYVFRPQDFPTLAGSQLPGQLVYYVLAAAPAIFIAWVSWHLLEKRFLKLKSRFTMAVPQQLAVHRA